MEKYAVTPCHLTISYELGWCWKKPLVSTRLFDFLPPWLALYALIVFSRRRSGHSQFMVIPQTFPLNNNDIDAMQNKKSLIKALRGRYWWYSKDFLEWRFNNGNDPPKESCLQYYKTLLETAPLWRHITRVFEKEAYFTQIIKYFNRSPFYYNRHADESVFLLHYPVAIRLTNFESECYQSSVISKNTGLWQLPKVLSAFKIQSNDSAGWKNQR